MKKGDLKMSHIQFFNKALKMSWLHKLLDPFNHSPRKVLLLGYILKWGGNNILYLSKKGLGKIAEKVNPFWKDVFLNLSELKQEKEELVIFNTLEPAHMVKSFDKNRWQYVYEQNML